MKLSGLTMTTVAAAVLLSGCAHFRQHKGVVLDSQMVSAVQAGVDNKDSVEKALGRPSFVGQFTPNDWYYVSRDVNQVASELREFVNAGLEGHVLVFLAGAAEILWAMEACE